MRCLVRCAFRYYLCCMGIVAFVIIHVSISASCGATSQTLIEEKPRLNPKNLCGKWRVDSVLRAEPGAEIQDLLGDGKATLVIVSEDKIRLDIEGVKYLEWTVKFDVTKTPVWVDLTSTEKGTKREWKGLLGLEEDSLILLLGVEDRPTDLAQKKGANSLLLKCKKEQ
jgi:uncharacterized protein (TIGR03067 family)